MLQVARLAPKLLGESTALVADFVRRHFNPHGGLALAAYQDLHEPVPAPEAFAASLQALQSADGAYANEPDRPRGSTPATAAAVVLMRYLDVPPDPRLAGWLLDRCREGGFFA